MEERFTGNFLDCPFQGRGTTGYDNIKQKYVLSWVDSMSTGILSCEGSQLQGATPKGQPALDNMKAYADIGGRVFASH